MFLLHLTTCFNLLDAICRQWCEAKSTEPEGEGVTQHVRPSVRVYLYTLPFQPKATASGVKHSLYADSTEGWQQHKSDWFNDQLTAWLAHWFDCFLSLSGGVSGGNGVEGALKCFIESGLIDSTAKRYRRLFPSLPARSRWALWAHMLACWMGANNISDALAYAHTGPPLQSHLFSTKSMHLSHHEDRFCCMQRDILTFQFSFVFNISIFWLGISCNYCKKPRARCQVKVSHFLSQHKKQTCINPFQSTQNIQPVTLD